MKKALLTVALMAGLSVSMAATPKDTLVWLGFGADPVPDFDPTQAYDTDSSGQLGNIYEPLYGFKGSSIKDFEPLIATAMPTITNGGKKFTIPLRKNVKFHSGNTLTCADVEYTFERALVTNNAESWGGTIIGDALVGSVDNAKDNKNVTWAKIDKSVECDNAGNVVFTLTRSDGSFISKLAFKGTGIIDKKFTVGLGDWSGTGADFDKWAGKSLKDSALQTKASGTGPYMLVKKSPTEYIYKAFDGYWGGKAKIENVIYRKVAEEATMILALQRGDADIITLTQRASLAQLKNSPGVTIIDDLPNVTSNAVFLNQNIKGTDVLAANKLDEKNIPSNFFSDINVRKAFQYAFNYKQYMDQVLLGKGTVRKMQLPDTFFGYDSSIPSPEFNMEKATAAFKKAFGGKLWETGFTIPVLYNSGNLSRQSTGEILKQNIERINPKFHVNVAAKPFGEINSDAATGKLAVRVGGWGADYADPDNFLPVFYASNGFYSPGLNMKDKQIDDLLAQAATTTDQAKRAALYRLVGQRAYALSPTIVLPQGVAWATISDQLKGFTKENYNPMLASAYVQWKDLSK